MTNDNPILETAERVLREEVAPHAADIDLDPGALRKALRAFCDNKLMAVRRPEAYGGPALSDSSFGRFQESVARYSGSLAFLQTQHQSAVAMIAKGENEALKLEYLPHMDCGKKLVGIGFSQLRRKGPPVMRAEECGDGYLLNGHVPWVTGWSFFPEFLVAAALADGRAVFGVVPLLSSEPDISDPPSTAGFPVSLPLVTVGKPMRLAAMESAMTVTADFQNWILPKERVAFVRPAAWLQGNDLINITLQSHFAVGCAQAGLDILSEESERKNLASGRSALQALSSELESCRKGIGIAHDSPDEASRPDRLKLRARAIDLAVRCAHAAVAASGGSANGVGHPAQRVYREALVYTISAQTPAILDATLQLIADRPLP